MKLTLTVKETAEFLGCSQQKIRIGLQREIFKFGTAIPHKSATRRNFTSYSYHIPKKKVEEYLGVTYEEWLGNKNE